MEDIENVEDTETIDANILFTDGTLIYDDEWVDIKIGERSTHVHDRRRRKTHMWKIPTIVDIVDHPSMERQNCLNKWLIDAQKDLYTHLRGTEGIAHVYATTERGVLMRRYEYQNLWQRIDDPDTMGRPGTYWVPVVFDIVKRCHRKRVIIGNLDARYFVFTKEYEDDADCEIHMLLSSSSRLIPPWQDFYGEDNLVLVRHDLLRLAVLIDAISSGLVFNEVFGDGLHSLRDIRNYPTKFLPLKFECMMSRYDSVDEMEVRVREMLQDRFDWPQF